MNNITETTRLDKARAQMDEVDRRGDSLPLYIGLDEDPVEALKKIRAFLERNNRDSQLVALAVVGLDRVLDKLEK